MKIFTLILPLLLFVRAFKVRYLWSPWPYKGSAAVHAILHNILGISGVHFQGNVRSVVSVIFRAGND